MKINRKKALIIGGIGAAIGVFFILQHILVSDEARIRKVIYAGKEAIEQEDLEGVMEQVSRAYQDDYGLNKLAIMAIFQRVFHEFDDIEIYVEEMQMEIVEQGRGRVTLRTWVTVRGPEGTRYIVGKSQDPCQVIFTLEKEGGKWRVVKAEGVELEEFLL